MFERFTDRARAVVVLAQEEARRLGHGYIGTEHILLALMSEAESIGARALTNLGANLADLRLEVAKIIGTSSGEVPHHIPFTPRAKKVLELSLRESLQLGHNYIGTEHILLGLMREGDGVAAQVLQRIGIDFNATRVEVAKLIGVDPMKTRSTTRPVRRVRQSQCAHPAEDLEVRPAEGFRTVRCRRCGLLVGVLPAA